MKDKFSSAPFVNIVDGFPDDALIIPTISADWEEITGYDGELGNRKLVKERIFILDIFAVNKSQRDEFAYKIFNDLDDGIPVYNYNEGFPEQGITPTKLGTLIPVSRKVIVVPVNADLVDELYYRAEVILTATYDQY